MRRLILCVMLVGCDPGYEDKSYFDKMPVMTNEQITKQVKMCHDVHESAWQFSNSHHITVMIQCYHTNRSDEHA